MNDKKIAEILEEAAAKITPGASFKAELEKQLKDAYKPEERFVMFKNKNLFSMLGFIGAAALLLFALNWAFHSLASKTVPGTGKTLMPTQSVESSPTPPTTPNANSYDFRGAKLYVTQPLPKSPDRAKVYMLKKDQPATIDEARALAEKFGIQSEVYRAAGQIPGVTDYVFTDGKQMLSVHSNFYFIYMADIVKNNNNPNSATKPNAEAIIAEFLKSHGFDFSFSIASDGLRGGYTVRPLAPDGHPMQHEFYSSPVMHVTLDENGHVLSLDASLMDYDQTPVGTFGIISAEEALQKMLDDTIPAGKIESGHSSAGKPPQEWRRQYPDNQTVTIYGNVSSYPPVDSSKPALILIDGTAAIGNVKGMDALAYDTFTEATGQYVVENGIRKFNVASWKTNGVTQTYIVGTLHRNGDQIILTADDGSGQYPLIDPPANAPLDTKTPESQLSITGVIVDGKLFWTYIQYFVSSKSMGSGGGGGGLGFYQLNLSGTPAPFPTAIPTTQSGLNPPFDKPRVDGLRGTLSITLHKKADGSQVTEYALIGKDDNGQYFNIALKGSSLQDPSAYQGLPFIVSGTVTTKDMMITVNVEQYKIPFPSLQFQILKGTQKIEDIQGQTATIFTTQSGQSYVQLNPSGDPDQSIIGQQGDVIQQEVLIIPDETFGGKPALRIYSSSIIQAGSPGLTITANQPNVMDDTANPNPIPTNYTPLTLTIEKVELVYFVSNPLYQANDPNRSPYIQPAWHFQGHYSNGDEFDIIVQALKQEFLSQKISPYIHGG